MIVSHSSESISLEWEKIGDYFEVYRNGELIDKTFDSFYSDSTIEFGVPYQYVIAAYRDSMLVDTIKIDTKQKPQITIHNSMTEEDLFRETTLETIVGKDFVQLSWNYIPDEDAVYQVFRDDELIAEQKGNTFIDNTVEPGTTYRYSVIGNKKLSEEKISQLNNHIAQNSLNLSNHHIEHLTHETFELARIVTTLGNNQLQNITFSTNPPYYSFRYLTFIPDLVVRHPVFTDKYFRGNNRGFDVLALDSKSTANIDITFDQSNIDDTFRHRKSVGPTWVVDQNNNPIPPTETAPLQASDSGMNIVLRQSLTDYKYFYYIHDVGIPYWDAVSPNINYSYDAEVYRNGSWAVKGSHDKAPAHEFYIYSRSTGSYTTIFQHEFDGNFWHLIPPAPNWHFNISG